LHGLYILRHARHSGPASPARAHAIVPGIHVFFVHKKQDVDGRDKPGHDEFNTLALSHPQ
jgi:hypothetical protein